MQFIHVRKLTVTAELFRHKPPFFFGWSQYSFIESLVGLIFKGDRFLPLYTLVIPIIDPSQLYVTKKKGRILKCHGDLLIVRSETPLQSLGIKLSIVYFPYLTYKYNGNAILEMETHWFLNDSQVKSDILLRSIIYFFLLS